MVATAISVQMVVQSVQRCAALSIPYTLGGMRTEGIRLDHHKPVRLVQIAGEFGQKLVRGHAHGRYQLQFFADVLFDPVSNVCAGAK